MKRACRAAAFCVALAGATAPTRADNASAVLLAPPATSSLQPPTELNPPPAISEIDLPPDQEGAAAQQAAQERDDFFRQAEFEDFQATARQQAYDNDWMLRDYNNRLKAQGLDTPAEREAVADLQAPDPSTPPSASVDPLLPSPAETNSPPRHSAPGDTGTEAPAATTPAPLFLPPLLPPETGPNSGTTVTRLDAWGSNTVTVTPAPDSTNPTLLVPGIHDLQTADNGGDTESTLDVPGLTAERQGLGDPGELDLPEQQMETATENADNRARKDFLLPTVASNDSSDFFKRQSEALAPPNASTPPATTSGNIPLGPSLPPVAPTAKVPVTTGIRSHVPDPFDLIGGHRDPSNNGSW